MKKFSALVLSAVFAMGSLLTIPPSQAQSSKFADVPDDHEYRAAIQYLKDRSIVEGYAKEGESEREFRADYELNRAELTKIMVEAQYGEEEINNCYTEKELKNWSDMYFSDVKLSDWFAKYVCVAKENNIVAGYPDGTFKPTASVNFAEAAKIISTAIGLQTSNQNGDQWFTPFVRALETRQGIPSTIKSFPKIITRGEMARMIYAAKENNVGGKNLSLSSLALLDQKNTELPQIQSCDALKEKLYIEDFPTVGLYGEDDVMMLDSAEESVGAPAPMAATRESKSIAQTGAGNAASEDFSTTNIQVEGVDEADIVKNDGQYIYLIKGNSIRIIDAYPGNNMEEVSSIEVDDEDFQPQEFYIDGEQMVIVGRLYRERYYPEPMPFVRASSRIAPGYGGNYSSDRMKVYVYNIRNKKRPVKQRSVEVEGSYLSSRKIGKNVYFVLNHWLPHYSIADDTPGEMLLPRYKDSISDSVEKPLVRCPNIQYFPGSEERNYLIVAALDISKNTQEMSRKVLLGNSQNIYASPHSLYVATPEWKDTVTRKPGNDWIYQSEENTLVYRFKLEPGNIEYQARGSVPGRILNQFSMDEYDKHFRIATTRGNMWDDRNQSTNNLYILKREDMKKTGEVTDIAPGEQIYSVRFMGKRAYMVTFKKVDPFFVIDVENPTAPKILGKLKIPGYSDYLHPFDEDHIIGFGKEAIEAEQGDFAWYQGMKLALFDVRDVANPKELFKETIGDRGTDSELLRNHKALLFDKNKGLLAFPVTVNTIPEDQRGRDNAYGEPTFSGAYVYKLDLFNGFQLQGKVTHFEDDSAFKENRIWSMPGRMIQRLLYIGEYLYSVSPDFVRSYDIDTVEPVNFLKLLGSQQDDVKYLEEEVMF